MFTGKKQNPLSTIAVTGAFTSLLTEWGLSKTFLQGYRVL
jgi:hypothetical protein